MSAERDTKPDIDPLPDEEVERYGIVVGIDGSPGAGHALAWAAKRVEHFGPIRPIVVWQYPGGIWSEPTLSPSLQLADVDFGDLARREVEQLLAEIPIVDRRALVVVNGPTGPIIVEYGRDANLVVVGTRGRGALADSLLGSVSCHVVNHAPVPVAVVPPTAELSDRYGRVVVGVDGSDNAVLALRWAIEHAPPASTVEALHVWSHPTVTMPACIPVSTDRAEQLAAETVESTVAKAMAGFESGRPVEGSLACGDARNVLGSELTEADLLVLGARGHRGVAHLLLGSVTTALVHKPKVATIVVPDTTDRD